MRLDGRITHGMVMDVESVGADNISFVFGPVGSFVDTTKYYTKEEIDAMLANVGVQSDWNVTDSSSKAYIKHKPTIPAAPVQSDWNESDSSSLAYIKNKPSALSQVQADWSQSDNTQVDYIKNKPTIPDAQIQADWNQTTSTAKDYIKNKPTIPTIPATATQSEINAGSSASQRTFTPQLLHDNAFIVEESYSTGSLKANKMYDFGEVTTALTIPSLDATNDLVSNALNFYALRFIAGADNISITFPTGVVVDDTPTINTGDYVEIMINIYVENSTNHFYASIKVWQAQ